ncbi:MAG: tetratricopeptide repeat protein, partial [bacterium]|nr:tetratricopeptide repeat protein [bacterium]
HRDLAAGLNNLAHLLYRKGELEEAEALARESLKMKQRLFGPDDVEVTKPLSTLATLLRRRGSLEEAEALYRRSLALRRRFEDPASPHLATALNALAGVLIARGDPQAAGPLYEEALRIRRGLYSGDHPELVTVLSNFGRQWLLVGEPEPAKAMLEEALAMVRRLAENRPSVGVALVERNLAWAHLETGEFASCEQLARSALEVVGPREGLQKAAAETRSLLGGCLVGLERYAEAEPHLREGYQGLVRTAGEEAVLTQLARERLARCYDAWGRPEQAARYRN